MSRLRKTSPAQMPLLELPEQVHRAKLPKLEEACTFRQGSPRRNKLRRQAESKQTCLDGPRPRHALL